MTKIGKIVELLIDWDNEEFEDLGVDIMSLVLRQLLELTGKHLAKKKLNILMN